MIPRVKKILERLFNVLVTKLTQVAVTRNKVAKIPSRFSMRSCKRVDPSLVAVTTSNQARFLHLP